MKKVSEKNLAVDLVLAASALLLVALSLLAYQKAQTEKALARVMEMGLVRLQE